MLISIILIATEYQFLNLIFFKQKKSISFEIILSSINLMKLQRRSFGIC